VGQMGNVQCFEKIGDMPIKVTILLKRLWVPPIYSPPSPPKKINIMGLTLYPRERSSLVVMDTLLVYVQFFFFIFPMLPNWLPSGPFGHQFGYVKLRVVKMVGYL